MKILVYITGLITIIILFSCSEPEPLPSATHYTRVPRPENLTSIVDTTITGKYRVTVSWQVQSMDNIKDFNLLRAFDQPADFATLALNYTKTTYVDSSMKSFSDTLLVFYYVSAKGKDNFVGQNSDTLKVTIIN